MPNNTTPTTRYRDFTGQTLDRVTVIRRYGMTRNHNAIWLCRCECGNPVCFSSQQLKKNQSLSCGCAKAPPLRGEPPESLADCLEYDPEKRKCAVLNALLCARKGECVFYRCPDWEVEK